MAEPTIRMMIGWLRDDIKELRVDVKLLQGFRWKIIGISTVCGILGGMAIRVLL